MEREINAGDTATIVCAVFQGLATLFVGARLFCRIKLLDKLYFDDWVILISLLCGWIAFAFSEKAVQYGLGKHWEGLTLDQKSHILLYTTLCAFFPGILALTLPKLAVVSLLCRLMSPSRLQMWIMWGGGALVSVNAIVCLATYMRRCTPFRANYDLSVPSPYCRWGLDFQVVLGIYTTIACAVVDLYLAVYPACVLSQLQMSRRKKIALSIALGIGSVSVLIAVYKATRMKAINSPDYSYEAADLAIWMLVEGAVVIIAACIPLLKPLVDMVLGVAFLGSKKDTLPLRDCERLPMVFEKSSKPKKTASSLTNLIKLAAGSVNSSHETILPFAHHTGLHGQAIESRTDMRVSYRLSDYMPSSSQLMSTSLIDTSPAVYPSGAKLHKNSQQPNKDKQNTPVWRGKI